MQSHIWCDCCECIRPLVIGSMEGDDVSGKFTDAADLLCGECHFVIATVFNPKTPPSQGVSE